MANPIVTITMENGDVMKAELYPEIAPNTAVSYTHLDLFLKTDRRAYRCFRPDGLPPSGHDLLSSA